MLHLREDLDRQHLGEAADGYWKSARWCDVAGLSLFLAEPADQLAVARACATPTLKVTDARILQAVVGPELVGPRQRHLSDLAERWRTGTVLVQVEAYGVASTRLESTTVEQAWWLGPRGWRVDTAASPLDADRPW